MGKIELLCGKNPKNTLLHDVFLKLVKSVYLLTRFQHLVSKRQAITEGYIGYTCTSFQELKWPRKIIDDKI